MHLSFVPWNSVQMMSLWFETAEMFARQDHMILKIFFVYIAASSEEQPYVDANIDRSFFRTKLSTHALRLTPATKFITIPAICEAAWELQLEHSFTGRMTVTTTIESRYTEASKICNLLHYIEIWRSTCKNIPKIAGFRFDGDAWITGVNTVKIIFINGKIVATLASVLLKSSTCVAPHLKIDRAWREHFWSICMTWASAEPSVSGASGACFAAHLANDPRHMRRNIGRPVHVKRPCEGLQ